ncbi:TolC family protein [Bacteroidetes bacterium endosymbiont of Geopemphigus sp.]
MQINYENLKYQYKNGIRPSIEVLSAQTSLKEAETAYINALYEILIKKVNLFFIFLIFLLTSCQKGPENTVHTPWQWRYYRGLLSIAFRIHFSPLYSIRKANRFAYRYQRSFRGNSF